MTLNRWFRSHFLACGAVVAIFGLGWTVAAVTDNRTFVQEARLSAFGSAFGAAVAVSEDTLAVGAPGPGAPGTGGISGPRDKN